MDKPRKKKLSIFCNIAHEDIISAPDVKSIYEVPVNFERDQLTFRILKKFGIQAKKNGHTRWTKLAKQISSSQKPVKIGIVGKYFETGKFVLRDSYISVIEAVKHAAWHQKLKPEIDWINARTFETHPQKIKELQKYDGLIVPGGFGSRAVEGKIKAITYAREHKIPFFGLCYGLQLATIEFARNVAKMEDANTTEINTRTHYPVIDILPEQKENVSEKNMGGTMRLGAYKCRIIKNTLAGKAYGKNLVSERHRHRYEVNNEFREKLEQAGLIFSGINPEKNLAEIIEIKNHPFFIGTQFHPEFKSRPFEPHPLFVEFIKAASKKK